MWEKLTDNRFVNLYHVDATSVHNTPVSLLCGFPGEERWGAEAENRKKHAGRSDHLQYLRREKR